MKRRTLLHCSIALTSVITSAYFLGDAWLSLRVAEYLQKRPFYEESTYLDGRTLPVNPLLTDDPIADQEAREFLSGGPQRCVWSSIVYERMAGAIYRVGVADGFIDARQEPWGQWWQSWGSNSTFLQVVYDSPPLSELDRFPVWDVAVTQRNFLKELRTNLRQRVAFYGGYEGRDQQGVAYYRWADHAEDCWIDLLEALDPMRKLAQRRRALTFLRGDLGDADYFAGQMPWTP